MLNLIGAHGGSVRKSVVDTGQDPGTPYLNPNVVAHLVAAFKKEKAATIV